MKKFTTLLGILVLVGAVAVPVMAWGPGWGWGGRHMMGYWGNGPGNGGDALTTEQQSRLNTLDQKFYEETRDLQNQILARSGELDATLNSTNPDLEKAKALQKEISDLRAKLDDKRLDYEVEVRKIVPEQQAGYGYGPHMGPYGNGMGYGHMGPYGYGRGYGHGYCWN